MLGINGSPCRDGVTATLLDAALQGSAAAGAGIERLDVLDLSIKPCVECRECDSSLACAHADDDMALIYKRIREVDGMILASPIFFMGVTAQMKAMIDRCQCFWVEKFVRHVRAYEGRRRPKGLFISTAGSAKPIVFEPALHTVRSFFAAIDYDYSGEILLGFTDDPEIKPRIDEALKKARTAGMALVR